MGLVFLVLVVVVFVGDNVEQAATNTSSRQYLFVGTPRHSPSMMSKGGGDNRWKERVISTGRKQVAEAAAVVILGVLAAGRPAE